MVVIVVITGESAREFAEILYAKCLYNDTENNWYSVLKINPDTDCNNVEYYVDSYDVIIVFGNKFNEYIEYCNKNASESILLITYYVYKHNYVINQNIEFNHILSIDNPRDVIIYSKMTARDIHNFQK